MANALLRASDLLARGPADPPAPDPSAPVPTWGYRGDEARIFELAPGESLPEGWVDSPAKAEPAAGAAEAAPEKPKRARRKDKADDDTREE
jgi:hypothetical protein